MNTDRPREPRLPDSEHPGDELISAYMDDEATEAERLAVSRHLPACEVCTSRLEELREISNLLGALPAVPAPRSFALPIEAANPAAAWFRWMRLGAAFATFAFVALFAFNISYVDTLVEPAAMSLSEQAVVLESEALESEAVSSMAEEPAPSDAQSASAIKPEMKSEEATEPSEPAPAEMAVVLESEAVSTMTPAPASSQAQSAPAAKMAVESLEAEEAEESTAPASAEMAARFEAQGTPASPVAGLEWVMLAVAIVLSFSACGIWLLRIRR